MSLPLEAEIRVVSDLELYPLATEFIRRWAEDNEIPRRAQLNGLLGYADDWKDLNKFVDHQSRKETASYAPFYKALKRELSKVDQVGKRLADCHKEARAGGIDQPPILSTLGRLFILHLTSEAFFLEPPTRGRSRQ
ncbi:MAG: hypothetical protein KatS3mg060_2884 [Dehalococcoidia bacterium]|nr:MAG: hypothetical protein KatS3mg060_2884 [Dehalococcoidia bacterium]